MISCDVIGPCSMLVDYSVCVVCMGISNNRI